MKITTTSIPAHSVKKGSVIVLSAGEFLVVEHPHEIGDKFLMVLEYHKDRVIDERTGAIKHYGFRHTEKYPKNYPITILVGGNSGGLA